MRKDVLLCTKNMHDILSIWGPQQRRCLCPALNVWRSPGIRKSFRLQLKPILALWQPRLSSMLVAFGTKMTFEILSLFFSITVAEPSSAWQAAPKSSTNLSQSRDCTGSILDAWRGELPKGLHAGHSPLQHQPMPQCAFRVLHWH